MSTPLEFFLQVTEVLTAFFLIQRASIVADPDGHLDPWEDPDGHLDPWSPLDILVINIKLTSLYSILF